jgi:hypothetical protein
VAAAIDRHGGWGLWRRLESISLSLVSLGGLLPSLKGYQRSFRLPHRAVVYPKAARTEWFAGAAPVAVFERGDVRLLDAGGLGLESRPRRGPGARGVNRRGYLGPPAHFGCSTNLS